MAPLKRDAEEARVRGGGWVARALAAAALVLGAAVATALCAVYTNGFKYALSLEAAYVVGPVLLLVASTVVPAAIASLRIGSPRLAGCALGGVVLAIGAAGLLGVHAFGRPYPAWRMHQTRTTDFDSIQTAAGRIEYAIALDNPFSPYHREWFVARLGGTEQRFGIDLFGAAPDGFGWSGHPSDFVTVYLDGGGSTLFVAPHRWLRKGAEGEYKVLRISLEQLAERVRTPSP